MDAETTKATLAEKEAHTELMKAHAGLMTEQARLTKAQAVSVEMDNAARK